MMPETRSENLPTSQPKKMGMLERSIEMQAVFIVCTIHNVSGCGYYYSSWIMEELRYTVTSTFT